MDEPIQYIEAIRRCVELCQSPEPDEGALAESLGAVFHALDVLNRSGSELESVSAPRVIELQTTLGHRDASSDFIDSLINFLVKSPADASFATVAKVLWVLVRLCRRRLDKLTVHEDNVQRIGERLLDIVQCASCRAMQSHEVAHPLCYLIMILASDNEDNQLALCSQGNAQDLVAQALTRHSEHKTTLQFALRAVRNLASHDENAGPLVQAGVCELLVSVLGTYAAVVSTYQGQQGKDCIDEGEHGSPDAVTSDLHVLDCALWATVNLICDDSTAVIFGAAGGVDALMTVLSSALHSDVIGEERDGVVHAALHAVRNLTSNTRSLMHYGGALPRALEVLSRLSSFSVQSKVPEAALWCIANFSGDANMDRGLLGEGGLEALSRCVVTVHQFDLSEHVKAVLTAAAASETPATPEPSIFPETRVTARDARHSVTGPVAEAALWCLRNLASSGTSFRSALLAAGALRMCCELLHEYSHRDGMATLCCETLLCLIAGNDDNSEVEEGGRQFVTPPNLQALRLLISVQKAVPMFLEQLPPLHELLRQVLAFHQAQTEAMLGEDDDLQQPALKLLVALVKYTTSVPSSSCTQTEDETNSLVCVVCKALERHPSDGMLARLGCEVLAALCYGIYNPLEPLEGEGFDGVLVHIPEARGAGAELLTQRGLLSEGQVVLGGKTMAAVLHSWMPETYDPPPPPLDEDEGHREEEN